MKFVNHPRKRVAGFWIEVVPGAVKICRHGGDEVVAKLLPISVAKFQPGDLGDRIPLVSRFKRTSEKRILADGLRGEFWINTRAAEEKEFADSALVGGFDNVVLDL